jgi:hypothetical protein
MEGEEGEVSYKTEKEAFGDSKSLRISKLR